MDKDELYIKDILAIIGEIGNTVSGMDYNSFLKNRTAYRSVERCFEIIGEKRYTKCN